MKKIAFNTSVLLFFSMFSVLAQTSPAEKTVDNVTGEIIKTTSLMKIPGLFGKKKIKKVTGKDSVSNAAVANSPSNVAATNPSNAAAANPSNPAPTDYTTYMSTFHSSTTHPSNPPIPHEPSGTLNEGAIEYDNVSGMGIGHQKKTIYDARLHYQKMNGFNYRESLVKANRVR